MKVIVGMSGGVDSAVAAYILKKEGHEVIGAHLYFNEEPKENAENVKIIADKLGIKIIEKDYKKEFRDIIIKNFVTEYKCGRTPNPCALCNGTMKFAKLLEIMKEVGADKIATGHYASIKGLAIKKSKNLQKDQSYMLYSLSRDQIKNLLLPIGDMEKSDVRDIARELDLPVADKKDSQDICFVKDIDYKEFIRRYDFGDDYKEKIARGELRESDILSKHYYKKGEFVDKDGKVLGFHEGIINYTIGQRKGLNIAFGERMFIKRIDPIKNQIELSDNDSLADNHFSIKDIVYQGKDSIDDDEYIVKLRYRHDGTKCKFDGGKFILSEPVRAITPGQAAVFYNDDMEIQFGGIIC